MSKIKVNNIESASGNTITIPAGFVLDIAGTLQGAAITDAVAAAMAGYDDGSGGGDSNTHYEFNFVNSPLLNYAYGAKQDNVGSIEITTAGTNYDKTVDTVEITGGGGTGATAEILNVVGSTGAIYSFRVTNGGTGYTSDPTVTITRNLDPVPAGSINATVSAVRTSPIINLQMGQIQSLLSRTKFVSGVLTDVESGCGEFFQFANSTQKSSPPDPGVGFNSPWFNIGNCPTGTTFAIDSAVATSRGTPDATVANTFPFGWFYANLTSPTGAGSSRGLSRWIYDFGTNDWHYVAGGATLGSSQLNVGGGFWMWTDSLGWHWSRCDFFPYFYIKSPFNWTSSGTVTGDPVGWSWFKPSSDYTERTNTLYIYGNGKWVDSKGTGANHPLANSNPGDSGSGQPSSTPAADVPNEPDVVIEAQ